MQHICISYSIILTFMYISKTRCQSRKPLPGCNRLLPALSSHTSLSAWVSFHFLSRCRHSFLSLLFSWLRDTFVLSLSHSDTGHNLFESSILRIPQQIGSTHQGCQIFFFDALTHSSGSAKLRGCSNPRNVPSSLIVMFWREI